MYLINEQIAQNVVDEPMPRHLRDALKGSGYDLDAEVGLPTWLRAGVAGMQVGVVIDAQSLRRQLVLEPISDGVRDPHGNILNAIPTHTFRSRAGRRQAPTHVGRGFAPLTVATAGRDFHTLVMAVRRHSRRAFEPDLVRRTIESMVRGCDHPDCERLGVHPAPRGRNQLRDYLWFCVEHVRAYNASWNYYAGMSEDEIEAEIRKDTVWQRPTWRWGARRFENLRDPFDVLGDDGAPNTGNKADTAPRLPPEVVEAFAIFGFEAPVATVELKARYKELVKLHHPDANGGDKAAEEKLKTINIAYSTLKGMLLT